MGELFTTREIAIAAWLVVLLGWGLTKTWFRPSAASVVRAAFQWKIVAVVLALATYTVGVVFVLAYFGLWTLTLMKDTVLWFLFAGIVTAFRSAMNSTEGSLWRQVMSDQLKIVIVFEYIVGTYTFSLAWEVVLQPALAIIVILHAVAESREEYAPAESLLAWLQVFIGLTILFFAASRAIGDQHGVETIRSIALGPILSILFIPAVYGLTLATTYESLFVLLRMGPEKSLRFHLYARWCLVRKLGLDRSRVLRFTRERGLRLSTLRTREELNAMLAEVGIS